MGKIKRANVEQNVDLKRTIAKVKLDQQILLKEKLHAIWNEKYYERTGPYDIKSEIRQKREQRLLINEQQKDGYK